MNRTPGTSRGGLGRGRAAAFHHGIFAAKNLHHCDSKHNPYNKEKQQANRPATVAAVPFAENLTVFVGFHDYARYLNQGAASTVFATRVGVTNG